MWRKINPISQLQTEKSTFCEVQTASGEVVSVLGASDIEFTIGNAAYTFKAHVVPKLQYAAIIGKDVLPYHDCVIDFKSGYLKISRDNIVPFLTSTSDNFISADSQHDFDDELPFFNTIPEHDSDIRIHAADTYEIPANSECVISGTFREHGLAETMGMIEPNN